METINEGSLLVDTTKGPAGEGPIQTGSVKALRAVLTTDGALTSRSCPQAAAQHSSLTCCAGAPIDARKLTAEVASLASEGGDVKVQHLIAGTAVIDSSRHAPQQAGQLGGSITLITAYAKSLSASSGETRHFQLSSLATCRGGAFPAAAAELREAPSFAAAC